MRDRVKAFKRIPAAKIRPNPKNWRRHPREQVQAFRSVLKDIGFVGAIIVREVGDDEYELIDGHLRVGILPHETIPALIVDLTDDETDVVLATFDPIGEMAARNREKLDALISELSAEVKERLADIPTIDIDEIPDLSLEPVEPPQPKTVVCPNCGAEFTP